MLTVHATGIADAATVVARGAQCAANGALSTRSIRVRGGAKVVIGLRIKQHHRDMT